MKTILFLLIVVCFTFFYRNNEVGSKPLVSISAIFNENYSKIDSPPVSRKAAIKNNITANLYANKILGVWALPGNENASFVINKKKIIYPDIPSEYSYFLKSDSILIDFRTYKETYLIYMKSPDTLILKNDTEHVYYRFMK